MVRGKSRTTTPQSGNLDQATIANGIRLIRRRIDEVKRFDPNTIVEQFDIPEVHRLSAAIEDTLTRTFGPDTVEFERYRHAFEFNNGPFNYAYEVPITDVRASLARSKTANIALLEQAVQSLEERQELATATPSSDIKNQEISRKVFVVHGREEAPRESVARFLEQIGLEVIILNERPNEGRTVIEKIEHHSDVGFAVVLLTPDDEGALKGEQLQSRARQNVLLELGFFIGRLTRKNVCVLAEGEIEIPSDWRGVINERFDSGGAWKQILARELQAAGYEVDWNKIMRP